MPRTRTREVCFFGGPCDGETRIVEGRLPMYLYAWHEAGPDAWSCKYCQTSWETHEVRRYQYVGRTKVEPL